MMAVQCRTDADVTKDKLNELRNGGCEHQSILRGEIHRLFEALNSEEQREVEAYLDQDRFRDTDGRPIIILRP